MSNVYFKTFFVWILPYNNFNEKSNWVVGFKSTLLGISRLWWCLIKSTTRSNFIIIENIRAVFIITSNSSECMFIFSSELYPLLYYLNQLYSISLPTNSLWMRWVYIINIIKYIDNYIGRFLFIVYQ